MVDSYSNPLLPYWQKGKTTLETVLVVMALAPFKDVQCSCSAAVRQSRKIMQPQKPPFPSKAVLDVLTLDFKNQ